MFEYQPWQRLTPVPRDVPTPREDHPGNIFLAGETVRVRLPEVPGAGGWRAVDDRSQIIAEGEELTGPIDLGELPIGHYRIEVLDGAGEALGWASAGVLAKLQAPIPQDSPVCVDSATSWFATGDPARQEVFARLAALAGANWIRDRARWRDMETEPGVFAENTDYDSAADAHHDAGLNVLQVFHDRPTWTADPDVGDDSPTAFPRDLRDAYRFCKAMGERYRGRVQAWEPWNEADNVGLGGHMIDEMCSFQKATYLGFRDADEELVVCWNCYAGTGTELQSDGVLRNRAWSYFDTYNIHSYSPPDYYLEHNANALRAAEGRPLWITECGVYVKYSADRERGDMTVDEERTQAEFLAPSYAASLFTGVTHHFYFILGEYREKREGGVEFGLLRHNDTPRQGYVALAAIGRLLAGAEVLGRLIPPDAPEARAYFFHAAPDGRQQDVAVLWANERTSWQPPAELEPVAVYDEMGRELDGAAWPVELNTAARFVVLPPGATERLDIEPPPAPPALQTDPPSRIVLQTGIQQRPKIRAFQAHLVRADGRTDIPVHVYNFSDRPLAGVVTVEDLPERWEVGLDRFELQIEPMGRETIQVRVNVPADSRSAVFGDWVTLRGDFDGEPAATLAFRAALSRDAIEPTETEDIPSAGRVESWRTDAGLAVHPGRAVVIDGEVPERETVAAALDPPASETPDPQTDGLLGTIRLAEGSPQVRIRLIEHGGEEFLCNPDVDTTSREPQRFCALFCNTRQVSRAAPGDARHVRPADIRTVRLEFFSRDGDRVSMEIDRLQWARF